MSSIKSIELSPIYPVHCNICNKQIIDEEPHVTEKAWKKYGEFGWSVIFELTLCVRCMQDKQQHISKESRERIQQYIALNQPSSPHSNERCNFTGKAFSECEFVQGAMMVDSNRSTIVLMSDEAIEMLQDQLSTETKEELDRFAQEQLGPPGAWKDLFSPTRPVLI